MTVTGEHFCSPLAAFDAVGGVVKRVVDLSDDTLVEHLFCRQECFFYGVLVISPLVGLFW